LGLEPKADSEEDMKENESPVRVAAWSYWLSTLFVGAWIAFVFIYIL
jgi:hypothetical protein